MRVWLLKGLPEAEPGFQAWPLDHIGLATWAPTRIGVLERIPAKHEEYRAWLRVHGLADPGPDPGIEVVEEIEGDEALFTLDRRPATRGEIGHAIQLLDASRSDLIATLEELPTGSLDWDPPYERFLPWAGWRTVREITAHLANTETHYYLASIGFDPPTEPIPLRSEWQSFLVEQRVDVIDFLSSLRDASEAARAGIAEPWSVRKVLRRMIWHERLHTKSIRRIQTEYARQQGE